MNDPSPVPSPNQSDQSDGEHLGSWKEIATYVKRDVSTVQRWEKREGMPVHRHVHAKRGSVYALSSELDLWLKSRRAELDGESSNGASGSEQAARPLSSPYWKWIAGIGLLCVFLGAAAYIKNRQSATVVPAARIDSLAVLPLQNLSGDPSQEYLADGMTEALIGRLSKIRHLRVISRTSVMRFKNTHDSVPEIAKALRVQAVVEGSVIRESGRIRVNIQLIRASSDEHLWAESYDRELRDALSLESELAQSIAAKVAVTITGEEQTSLAKARQVSPEVYENYLKGRFSLSQSRSEQGVQQSIHHFEEAIEKDPAFAPAYLGLATAYESLSTVLVGAAPPEIRAKVVNHARKALELDPDSAEAHVLIAITQQQEWHWAEAEAEYKLALQLSPNEALAYDKFAWWFLCQGRTEEALSMARRGRELDPLAVSGTTIGWILFQSHRYEEAIHELTTVLAVQPDDVDAHWYLGFALIANGKPGDAIPHLEKAVTLSKRSPGTLGLLTRAYAHAGRRADALRLLAELKQRNQRAYVPAGAFVNAYLGLGDNERALTWLERAYEEKSNILQWIKVHPYFDPLRDDPRFSDLIHRVGLD